MSQPKMTQEMKFVWPTAFSAIPREVEFSLTWNLQRHLDHS